MPLGKSPSLEDLRQQNAAAFEANFGTDPRATIKRITLERLQYAIDRTSDDEERVFNEEVKRILEKNRDDLTANEKKHLQIWGEKMKAYALSGNINLFGGAAPATSSPDPSLNIPSNGIDSKDAAARLLLESAKKGDAKALFMPFYNTSGDSLIDPNQDLDALCRKHFDHFSFISTIEEMLGGHMNSERSEIEHALRNLLALRMLATQAASDTDDNRRLRLTSEHITTSKDELKKRFDEKSLTVVEEAFSTITATAPLSPERLAYVKQFLDAWQHLGRLEDELLILQELLTGKSVILAQAITEILSTGISVKKLQSIIKHLPHTLSHGFVGQIETVIQGLLDSSKEPDTIKKGILLTTKKREAKKLLIQILEQLS
jgi:hypothetical protein